MVSNITTQLLNNHDQTCVPTHLDPLIPGLPEKYTLLILPIVSYWTFSLAFHLCDEYGYLSKYKLHTLAEFRKRNRVSVREIVREVLIQHTMQTLLGGLLARYEPDELTGCEGQDVAMWASRIRPLLRATLPLGSFISENQVIGIAGFFKAAPSTENFVSAILSLDGILANVLYYILIPAFQYVLAAFWMNTWQYLIHRFMHTYHYLYRTFHSRHHRLYVPYAFGGLYNRPLEGFLEDTIGSLLAFKAARMSIRQGIWFFTVGTLKTVDDHSGFRLPWDPFQLVTDNNAFYHDIHHQSWGMKVKTHFFLGGEFDRHTFLNFRVAFGQDFDQNRVSQSNFSQPFTSLWDRVFGTRWQGSEQETQDRYESGKAAAGKSVSFKTH